MIGRFSRLCQALSGPVACHYGANNSCPQAVEDTGRPGPANRPWQVSLECWHCAAKLLFTPLLQAEKTCGVVPFPSNVGNLFILDFRVLSFSYLFPLSRGSLLSVSVSMSLFHILVLSQFLIFFLSSFSPSFFIISISLFHLSLSHCSPLCPEFGIWCHGTGSPPTSVPLLTHRNIVVELVKRHGRAGCIYTDSTQH